MASTTVLLKISLIMALLGTSILESFFVHTARTMLMTIVLYEFQPITNDTSAFCSIIIPFSEQNALVEKGFRIFAT